MEVEKLQEYYNTINACSLSLQKEVDFDYIQSQLSKMAIYNDTLNTVIGEVSVQQTLLRNKYTNSKFDYDVRATDLAINDPKVTQLATVKERNDFINFFLLKDDYKSLIDLDASIKDLDQLLKLAHKKSRDIEKLYSKLKLLWDTVQLEIKSIKKLGSDGDYIAKVRDELDNTSIKPIFTDDAVEQMKNDQYNTTEPIKEITNINSDIKDTITNLSSNSTDAEVKAKGYDLSEDLLDEISEDVDDLIEDLLVDL